MRRRRTIPVALQPRGSKRSTTSNLHQPPTGGQHTSPALLGIGWMGGITSPVQDPPWTLGRNAVTLQGYACYSLHHEVFVVALWSQVVMRVNCERRAQTCEWPGRDRAWTRRTAVWRASSGAGSAAAAPPARPAGAGAPTGRSGPTFPPLRHHACAMLNP